MKPKNPEIMKQIVERLNAGQFTGETETAIESMIVDLDMFQELVEKLAQLFIDTCVDWPEWFSDFVTEYEIEYDEPDCH